MEATAAIATEAATTAAKNVRDFNWDTPYRYAASTLAIATLVGMQTASSPLTNLATAASAIRIDSPAAWLLDTDRWLHETLRSPDAAALSAIPVLLLALCLLSNVTSTTTVTESRAASTGWVAIATLVYFPSMPIVFYIVLALVVLTVRLVGTLPQRDMEDFGIWAFLTLINFCVAAVWLPLSLILWAITAEPRLSTTRSLPVARGSEMH